MFTFLFFSILASSTSDLSFVTGTQTKEVSGLPDPADPKSPQLLVISSVLFFKIYFLWLNKMRLFYFIDQFVA